jgi:hypothetical protein
VGGLTGNVGNRGAMVEEEDGIRGRVGEQKARCGGRCGWIV